MKADKWIYINMLVGKLWTAVRDAAEAHREEQIGNIAGGTIAWFATRQKIRENYEGHPEKRHFKNDEMWMLFSRLSDSDKMKLYSAYPGFKSRLCYKNNDPRNLMLREVDLSWADRQRQSELEDYLKV